MKGLLDVGLFAVSRLYGAAMRLRNALYESALLPGSESEIPVISIGNISAGGNAKTPLCLHIAEELKKRDFRPVILSRGYGGSARGPHVVEADDDPARVGDEPLLLARRQVVPVVISRDRVAGCGVIAERQLGNVILLDDGFQHRRLKRQLDIVSVDVGSEEAVNAFLEGGLLPFGLFREPRDEALARADAVIFSARRFYRSPPDLDARLFRVLPQGLQVYRSHLTVESTAAVRGGALLKDKRVAAFCAIAKPERFFDTLTELGFELAGCDSFPDHYRFNQEDLDRLRRRYPGLPLVCTEKDAVKIEESWAESVYEARVSTRIYPYDAFFVQVVKKLRGHKPKARVIQAPPAMKVKDL